MPTPLTYHSGPRGALGFLKYVTGTDGVARGAVVPAVSLADSDGNAVAAGTAADPTFGRNVGGSNIATGQAASSISPAAALLIVAARAGRQSVVLTNITGTQPVYFTATAATTGVTTGFFLAGTAGATITISTAAALYATSPTAAQTISFLENY